MDDAELVGGPFAVIESDPGVFTTLVRRLGIRALDVVELYDIEPWAVDHLRPHGLVFCFLWQKDRHRPADFDDPAADSVWFANQLSDDSCATQAILNVLLNCPAVDIGAMLAGFKAETAEMSSVMKGLAITNAPQIRAAHNAMARPADIRGARHAIAAATAEATKQAAARDKPPPAKRAKTGKSKAAAAASASKKAAAASAADDDEESFHFIGYVPAHGKVWELDGIKSGPLEVGELPPTAPPDPHTADGDPRLRAPPNWMDVVRPALRRKMRACGGGAGAGDNIRFSLLALVDGQFQRAADELELLKRARAALERRLGDDGLADVDPALIEAAQTAFSTTARPSPAPAPLFGAVGARRLASDREIMDMPARRVPAAWEACVRAARAARDAVEDEGARDVCAHTEHVKRTHDYEPFLRAYVGALHAEGLLNPLLGLDVDGRKVRAPPANAKETGNSKGQGKGKGKAREREREQEAGEGKENE